MYLFLILILFLFGFNSPSRTAFASFFPPALFLHTPSKYSPPAFSFPTSHSQFFLLVPPGPLLFLPRYSIPPPLLRSRHLVPYLYETLLPLLFIPSCFPSLFPTSISQKPSFSSPLPPTHIQPPLNHQTTPPPFPRNHPDTSSLKLIPSWNKRRAVNAKHGLEKRIYRFK